MNEVKKQIFIDASALKNSSCFRKLWWNIVNGYKYDDKDEISILMKDEFAKDPNTPIKSINKREYKMAFGSAFHIFLEDYYNEKPIQECIKRATDYYQPYNDNLYPSSYEFRTNTHLINSFKLYKDHFPRRVIDGKVLLNVDDFIPQIDAQGKRKIEYKFAIPVWGNDNFDLILAGTIDMVASYCGMPTLLVDHKTSSVKSFEKTELDNFFDPYNFDIQTMLYSKVYKDLNNLDYYPPVFINGIFLKKTTKAASELGVFDGVHFKRSYPIEYTQEQMKWFEGYLQRKLSQIIYFLKNQTLERAEDLFEPAACKQWGLCEYFSACSMPTEELRNTILQTKYIQKQYNPLKFRD